MAAIQYGSGAFCFSHAWCVDRDGSAIDPTWDMDTERAYLGVTVTDPKVRPDDGGDLLEDHKRGLPWFRDGVPDRLVGEVGQTRQHRRHPPGDHRGHRSAQRQSQALGLRASTPTETDLQANSTADPEATPAQVIRNLERMYVSALTGTGAAVGRAAAAPGVGTGVALALSAGEVLSSLELSALFALSIAEVHGVRIDEIERRRTIVMGILLGGSGSATIAQVAERTGQHSGRHVVAKVPIETLRQINRVMGVHFVTKYGTKQGIIVLGRVAPFGIGAVIGGGANAAVAALAVRAARHAFGPPPTAWPWLTHSTSSTSENSPG